MSPNANEQLTRHFEREAEATRHSLANSLREIDERLTPGQMFDEVLSYAKGGSGTFVRALSNAIRENPMPSLLIGAGCILFFSEKLGISRALPKSRRAEQDYGYSARGAEAWHDYDRVRDSDRESDTGTGIGEAAREKVATAAASVKQGIASVGDAIGGTAERARETAQDIRDDVSETVEQVKERAESVRQRITEKAMHSGEQAMTAGRQVKEKAADLMHEQPLLIAGLGLAFGAAIAALLPSTRIENQLMGETSDALKKKIGDTATQQFRAAKDTASELVENAKQAVEREGISASDVVRRFSDQDSSASSSEQDFGPSPDQPLPRV